MQKRFVILTIIYLLSLPVLSLAAPDKTPLKANKTLKTSIDIKGIGTLSLKHDSKSGNETQLILTRPGNITIIADTYEGLEPFELLKCDFNNDEIPEFIATLKYPDSQNVIPYVYSFTDSLEKVFPKENQEADLLNCREVFISQCNSLPSLCLKYSIAYHDFGPPELFKLEMYTMKDNNQLVLTQIGYNEGNHFNLLMNLAAEYMHKGRTLEAATLYNQALTISTGDLTPDAFAEGLFSEAEALKYSGKYAEAMKLFEKLVLEHTDSNYTELAQKELEFLFANKNLPDLLNQYFVIQSDIINDRTEIALEKLNKLIQDNPKCPFMDRLLFAKAELLISDNHLEEAVSIYKSIKVNHPNSSLIDTVDEMLDDLESKPEDTDGL